MRVFVVRLPSGQRYWTVLDEDLRVVAVADGFLRHQRFGRDGAESTTKAYAHAIVLFLRWRARTGRSWQAGVEQFALFMTWLAHAGPSASGAEGGGAGSGVLLAGPGVAPARSASRINGVLTAVRGMVVHAVSTGQGPAGLVPLLYEVADDRDLPEQARGEDGRMAWRMRARHRLREPETAVDRASDEEIVALLGACRSARDRLIVLLMARAGLRRGEVCGLRRSDVHLLVDSRRLGCEVARAHLHVVRREDNLNGAWAKPRRQRVVPLDFLAGLRHHLPQPRREQARRRQRVIAAFDRAAAEGTEISASGIARAAGVDRTFLYRHRDLLEKIHALQAEPSLSDGAGPAVTRASLQADLLAAHERAVRLNTRVQHLEKRLSEVLGDHAWRESGLGAPADIDALNQKITLLEQQVVDLRLQLEERDDDLAAARATNRELMTQLNHATR
ncbi:MAG: Recombinase XerD [Actinomycetia bacterium]|nr:Recombinase XerD [Actinomycetes bacterium]